MKTGNSLQSRAEKINQKNELKNLRDAHRNELENIKNSHSTNKAHQRNSFRAELGSLRNESDKKLILENIKNEKVLNELKTSIQDVKESTAKEKQNIQSTHNHKMDGKKAVFEQKYTNLSQKQNFLLQELDQQSQIDIQKMNRRHQLKEQEFAGTNKFDSEQRKNAHLNAVQLNKEHYSKQQAAQSDKFHAALLNQKENHDKTVVATERTHQKVVEDRKKVYQQADIKIQDNGRKRIQQSKQRFENNYNNHFEKNQTTIQHLSRNKEKILNSLKSMFKKEVKIELDKEKDPFYQFHKIDPKLTKLEDGSGYNLSILTDKDSAKDFQLTGSDRELKITMKRDYKFKNTENNGEFNSVKKFETYTTKIPVENIIEPDSIVKSYKDGKLNFNIKLA